MKTKIKKCISILTIVGLLFSQIGLVVAYEVPTAPPPPSAPTAPTPPPGPTSEQEDPAPTPPPPPTVEELHEEAEQTEEESNTSNSSSSGDSSSSATSGQQTGNQSQDGALGDIKIDTGEATNQAGVITVANSNLSAGVGSNSGSGASITNSGNGSESDNSGSIIITDNSSTFQDNSATVKNNLNQDSVTGQNSASYNTGGDSSITTGDANTTSTVMTVVNTNVDVLAVAEFNIADDHMGDFILDFNSGCISGCLGGNLTASNTGNGTDSTNSADITQITNNNSFQTNEADVENNLILASDSGNNSTSFNTDGDSIIDTGDANVSANILTAVNNNIIGNVIYSVVNIFGDLIGDIIMPEGYASTLACSSCGGDLTAINTNNGSGSTNNTDITQINNNETFQVNSADIENNLILSATTGNNDVSQNTGGDSSIKTGDTNINARVLNVANSNIDSGNWWLVLVNEAGNWIGRILGSPDGANFAGSAGTEFIVNSDGEITAINSGNGSDSTNASSVTSVNNNTIVQENNAKIVNNVNLSANTGGNSASSNTGGNSKITTGDANVVANIVNFVNNNITGGGKLYVTVINVFGSWLGDFVGPGLKKEKVAASGSAGEQSTHQSLGSSSSGSSSSSDNGSTSTGQSAANTSTPSAQSQPKQVLAYSGSVNGQDEVKVADFSIGPETVLGSGLAEGTKRNSIKINLAWLLLVVPAAAVALVLRKKLMLFQR